MQPAELRPDCANCCALCCVAPPFDSDQGFGYDKPAHAPCKNLLENNACSIHADLKGQGFPGCAVFDCYGAGQRTTQHLFKGASWRDSPELAERMFAAYAKMRALHELLVLLDAARTRITRPHLNTDIEARYQRIELACLCVEDAFSKVDSDSLKKETMLFLRGLQPADLGLNQGLLYPKPNSGELI
jgi:hypothetical protein